MARIRTLKPEFFRSRSLAECSRDARLTFQGLWVEADDAGRGIADARILKGAIWPLDDDLTPVDIERHLSELVDKHIQVYEVDGERYYCIKNWEKHQAAAYRKSPAKYPEPPCTNLHESSRVDTSTHGEMCLIGREGNKEGNEDKTPLPGAEPSSSWSEPMKTAHQLARIIADRRHTPPDDPAAFIAGTRKRVHDERLTEINDWLAMGLDPMAAAERMAGHKTAPKVNEPGHVEHPSTCVCEGSGWVPIDPDDESRASYVVPCVTEWPNAEIVELAGLRRTTA